MLAACVSIPLFSKFSKSKLILEMDLFGLVLDQKHLKCVPYRFCSGVVVKVHPDLSSLQFDLLDLRRPELSLLLLLEIHSYQADGHLLLCTAAAHGAPAAHDTSGHGSHGDHGNSQPHESPLVMVFPMVILAIMAVGCGWSFWAGGAAKFLGEGGYYHMHPAHWHEHGFLDLFAKVGEEPLPLVALVVALAGIGLAWVIYSKKWISAERIGQMFAPVHTLLSRKYYFDELYEQVLVVRILLNGLFYVVQLFDTYIVDGIVNGVGKLAVASGGILRRLQTGQLQGYGLAIAIGVLIIVVVFFAYR